MPVCTKCNKEKEADQLDKYDENLICYSCLYQNNKPFKIYPIGFVDNSLERGEGFGMNGLQLYIIFISRVRCDRSFLEGLMEKK